MKHNLQELTKFILHLGIRQAVTQDKSKSLSVLKESSHPHKKFFDRINDIYFSVKLSNKPPAPIVEFEIPYLGAEDVIDEVITLLAKLENDRQDTKKNLQKEKERVDTLSSKIDNLSEQRLLTLPDAVQSGKNTVCNRIESMIKY